MSDPKEELRRRKMARQGLLSAAFDKQRDFITDPCRIKAACCTRRSGKTFACGLYCFYTALNNPGCTVLYLGLTRESAKRIVMRDVVETIDRKYGIGIDINWSTLEIRFPNGSVIYVAGADQSDRMHDRFLGQKYALAIIDEAAEWKSDLINLVFKTLRPAMVDVQGTIALVGVPGNVQNFFYDVVTGQKDEATKELLYPGWSTHAWTAFDNPHIAKNWKQEIDDIKRTNPGFLSTPYYRQQYLGEWVVDLDAQCYRFDGQRNRVDRLPGEPTDYTYVLGVDLGWADPTAFTVVAYQPHDPTLYVVHSSKQSEMLPDEIAQQVHELEGQYRITRYVIDAGGGGKLTAEDLTRRLRIPFDPAPKANKEHFISLMSNELVAGHIKVAGPDVEPLVKEWNKLVWATDDRGHKLPQEHRACENHCADSALYAFRASYQFIKHQPVRKQPLPNTEEWMVEYEKKLADRIDQEKKAKPEENRIADIERELERLFR